MIQDQQLERCHHIKVNGVRCGSPSLRQKMFCYFHNRVRKLRASPVLPILEDANALQLALGEVLQALFEDRIDGKKAAGMGYLLQIAAYNLRTGGVNYEPSASRLVLHDPSDDYFEHAMKKLPENASVDEVMKVINTAAKG